MMTIGTDVSLIVVDYKTLMYIYASRRSTGVSPLSIKSDITYLGSHMHLISIASDISRLALSPGYSGGV